MRSELHDLPGFDKRVADVGFAVPVVLYQVPVGFFRGDSDADSRGNRDADHPGRNATPTIHKGHQVSGRDIAASGGRIGIGRGRFYGEFRVQQQVADPAPDAQGVPRSERARHA